MAIAVGSYVRYAVTAIPPPTNAINANSAMVVTAIDAASDARGAMLTLSREGKYCCRVLQSQMTEVRGP